MLVYENPDFLNLPRGPAELLEGIGKDSFFSLTSWYDLMAKHGIAPGRQVRLYVDRDEFCRGALVSETSAPAERATERELRSLTNAYSCEHPILIAPGNDADGVCDILAAGLMGDRPAWERVTLSGLDPSDRNFRPLAQALRRAGLAVRPFFDSGTWYEQTSGLSFQQYLAERPSVLRNTWRRKAAKVGASGQMRIAYYDNADDIEQAIEDYDSIYRESWKPEEGFPRFMPALIRLAARIGALRMGVLHLEGIPAAAQFWILWRGRACIFKLAYRERFASLSVGTILTMLMFERVLERDKPAEINFGRGDDPYKKLWLPKRRERWGLAAANPRTIRGLRQALRFTAARMLRPLISPEPRPPI